MSGLALWATLGLAFGLGWWLGKWWTAYKMMRVMERNPAEIVALCARLAARYESRKEV